MMSSILAIPITGDAIAQQQLIDLSWWAILFMTSLLTMGMVIGIVAADTGRGNMISLFIIIFFYGTQIIGRVIPAASDLNEYNPLNWYQPDAVLLGQDIPLEPIQYASIMLGIGILTFSVLFRYRDLIPEAAIELPLISRFRRRRDNAKTSEDNVIVQENTAKSDRDSIFVFWARPLEKRFPITADFIYSERRVLMILFWVIIMFYPVQLLAFDPNDPAFVETIEGTIETFSSSGIFEVFTYGHDITYNLWLWLIITQAIGNHWLFFLPLTAHLIRKILKGDMNNETAELYGTLPLKNYNVLFQRMFAVFLELIFVVVQTIGWLVLSEAIIGVTFNITWEIIALLAVIPLYWFLITTGLTVGLLIDRGVDIARGSLVILLLLFFARILIDDVFIPDLLGLYDPVLLITEQTLSVQNYGIIWLLGMAILSSFSLFGFSSQFRWFDLENDNDPIPT